MRDAVGSVQSVLILGGRSEIGLATARLLIADRTRTVVLAVRDPAAVAGEADELRRSGARVEVLEFDADAPPEAHRAFCEKAFSLGVDIDLVLVAFGLLGDQEEGERDPARAVAVLRTNLLGAVSVMLPVADRLRAQGHGDIAVLSSVAGRRARRANYTYGASKAGLDMFAQGLAEALRGSGVGVTIVRPGFVRTKMTAGLEPAPLSVSADEVAGSIVDGVRRRQEIVWAPPRMRLVMFVLGLLPGPLFRRLVTR